MLSINRGFSAPVAVTAALETDDLVFLAEHDDDPFARYEAMQCLALRHLVAAADGRLDEAARASGRGGDRRRARFGARRRQPR